MGRMVERMRAVGARWVLLFIAVAALAASACAGEGSEVETAVPQARQAGVVQQGEARADGQLVLTLTAPHMCEVEGKSRDVHASRRNNDDGTSEEVFDFGHWTDVATIAVEWRVSGGTPPYTLVIDGETQDADGEYTGPSGEALVSCALDNGETYFSDRWGETQRWHRTRPTVDAGLKSVSASVTDSAGATADAVVDVHAVRVAGGGDFVLRGGNTYRISGTLFTIPEGLDLIVGEVGEPEGGPTTQTLDIRGSSGGRAAMIVIDTNTGEELGRRVYDPSGGNSVPGWPPSSLHDFLDEFSASRGLEPGGSGP